MTGDEIGYGEPKHMSVFCDMRKGEQGGTNDHVAYSHVCDVAGIALCLQCPVLGSHMAREQVSWWVNRCPGTLLCRRVTFIPTYLLSD